MTDNLPPLQHHLQNFLDCLPGSEKQEITEAIQLYASTAIEAALGARGAVPADSGVLTGKYGNVLAPFAALMEAELHANSRKGDRPGWLTMSPSTGLLEIYWHTAKLSAAVKNNDIQAITEHSADVANMAMMLLDVCGGLAVAPQQVAQPSEVVCWACDGTGIVATSSNGSGLIEAPCPNCATAPHKPKD